MGGPVKPNTMRRCDMKTEKDSIEPLALRPVAAARALGVSCRTLWTWTQAGVVPHVRVGRVILFPCDALKAWLAAKAAGTNPGEGRPDDDGGVHGNGRLDGHGTAQ